MTIVGFIGLGAMGMPMAQNVYKKLCQDDVEKDETKTQNYQMYVYDINSDAIQSFLESCHNDKATVTATAAASPMEMGECCNVVISMVPNDAVLRHVVTCETTGLLGSNNNFKGIHISCSTVHPDTSRELSKLHSPNANYIGAPIFARADGVAQRAASFVVGGDNADAIEQSMPWLESMALGIFKFSDSDAGAGNVVKLCGNFMIAAAIESCAEACSLAEQNGLDRVAVMDMLTSTIFDCLIYKGYGMRTAHRQHIPGQPMVGPGFQLDLGLKDIALTHDVAQKTKTPMPFCSLLQDRFLTSQNQGRGKMDWSALGLLASQEAGIDVSAWLPGGEKAAESGDSIAPV